MTDTPRPTRATRADVEAIETTLRDEFALRIARLEDEHDRELLEVRRQLARMVLSCGVTLDDLAHAAFQS